MKHVVGAADEFPPGTRRIVEVGRRRIGVFRVGDDFYAMSDACPHQGGPLCSGRLLPWASTDEAGEVAVDEDRMLIACPWHGWEYELSTGQSFMGPGETPARSFTTTVEPGSAIAGAGRTGDRVPGPYVAETFEVAVERDYVVIDTKPVRRSPAAPQAAPRPSAQPTGSEAAPAASPTDTAAPPTDTAAPSADTPPQPDAAPSHPEGDRL